MHEPKWPFLLAHESGVVVVDGWDRFCTLGRAPRTKKTMPDFREWCRVIRHPRVFRRLTGCQRDTPVLGCHIHHFSCFLYVIMNSTRKSTET